MKIFILCIAARNHNQGTTKNEKMSTFLRLQSKERHNKVEEKIKWKREIMHPRPEKGEPSRCKTCWRKENNYHCAETSVFSSL